MTGPFTPIGQNDDRLDIAKRGGQLMIVKVWDVPEYVRTPHNKDGMVRVDGRDPFPNRAVRAAVVDLGDVGPDGLPGRLYQETWFQAFSLMKDTRKWVGQLKLITWMQDQEPRDAYGNPKQTNPYTITDYSGNAAAVELAQEYLARHPEFHDLPAPEPYDGKPPAEAPQYAPPSPPMYSPQPGYGQQGPPPGWGTRYPQAQPQQPDWQSPQAYPPAQPAYQQPPAPQPWQQGPPPQQYPQQQPAAWNTAAPPPGYQPPQQQYPPQQAPQAQPGSFYDAVQQMPPGQIPQGPPVNHHGQPQPQQPPY